MTGSNVSAIAWELTKAQARDEPLRIVRSDGLLIEGRVVRSFVRDEELAVEVSGQVVGVGEIHSIRSGS